MDFEAIASELRQQAQAMHEAREAALPKCRQVIQLVAKAIRHIHRRQFDGAEKLLAEGRAAAAEARKILVPFGNLYHAGYLHDAEKELVEAHAVFAVVQRSELPRPESLGVGIMAYLNGMGEAASEMRRFALDEVRGGNLEEAERILAWMDSVIDELTTFDYSDSMTGGLRRTCDSLRAVIERTRSDLTLTASQQALTRELRNWQK